MLPMRVGLEATAALANRFTGVPRYTVERAWLLRNGMQEFLFRL